MSSLLSIVIPAYNAEKYIEETIESALVQTISDYEIIIVNDGSTDSTPHIISRYALHPRVRALDYGSNRGAAHAYNYGLLHSQAKYITFLDADDLYMPEYCERVIARIEQDQADMGFSNLWALNGRDKSPLTLYGQPRDPRFPGIFGGPDKSFPYGDWTSLRTLVLLGVHISPRAIYKRSLFLDYGIEDYRLRIAHDWLRHIRFLISGAHCTFVDEPLGYYRIHPEGNSQRDPLANYAENIKVLETAIKELHNVMTDEERTIATSQHKNMRAALFQALANSDAKTQQIIQYLLDKNF